MSLLRPIRLAPVLGLSLLMATPAAPRQGAPTEAAVRDAMLRTYLHGVDDSLARQILPAGSVPALRSLLADPSSPRRDNVVAFLAHLDSGEATRDLLHFLAQPPAGVEAPEEDRALLLAPQALGRIAARGDAAALEALLEMTARGSDGGPLAGAASHSRNPDALRSDLFEMAFRGLAFSRSPKARSRLLDLSLGRVKLQGDGRDLSRAARESLRLFDELGGPLAAGRGLPVAGAGGGVVDGSLAGGMTALTGGGTAELFDTQSRAHDSALTYANHASIPTAMNDARLDAALDLASLRAGRADFSDDVACCITVTRSGSARVWGAVGDGLDIVDTRDEMLQQVLPNSTARVKVVRAINWCGSFGSNIIGCAFTPGNGIALVALGNLGSEAVLWIHEYGHNTGLLHSADSRAIMFGIDSGGNNVLAQSECNSYHSPSSSAGMTVVDTGACTDADGDQVQDGIDNCPNDANSNQFDADGDAMGDACDTDDDNDGIADADDCARLNPEVWRAPGEVQALALEQDPSSGTILTWIPPADPGGQPWVLAYDTIQSVNASDFTTSAICVESSDGTDTSASASRAAAAWIGESNQVNARFGASVASAGDVNGDGFDEILVGAPQYANGQDQEGRLYLFPGSPVFNLFPAVTRELDGDFAGTGSSVAGLGDVNGDGFADVAVGAPSFEAGLGAAGRVAVYHGSSSGLAAAPSWTADGDQDGARFGASVAPAGDVNHDGFSDLIVGAPLYNNGLPAEGKVFLYLGSPSGLGSSPAWTARGGQASAQFGVSVAAAGDVNGDGRGDVLVGAPLFDNGQTNEGKAFLFLGTTAGLSAGPAWSLEGNQTDARLGASVAGVGDVNGDGFADIVVGAPMYDGGQADEGKVFLHAGSASGPGAAPIWTVEGERDGAGFGASVSGAGDFNGDGFADLLVGASGYTNGEPGEGRALIYAGSPAGPGAAPVRTAEANQAGAALGGAAAAAGDVNGDGLGDVVIGAQHFNAGQLGEGRAFLHAGSRQILPPPGAAFFFLVRAENQCGQGPLGSGSDGAPRSGISCP